MNLTKEYVNMVTYDIISCAIAVHKELGPGLLEGVYEKCLVYELRRNTYKVEQQLNIPITFREIKINADLKLDIFVEGLVVVELKAIENLVPLHEAQTLSYMKLLKAPKGILINFCSDNIVKTAKHYVNEYFRALPDK